MSPKNRVLKGYLVQSMLFKADETNEYEVLIKVKNKKGKGYRIRVVKVHTTTVEEFSHFGWTYEAC